LPPITRHFIDYAIFIFAATPSYMPPFRHAAMLLMLPLPRRYDITMLSLR